MGGKLGWRLTVSKPDIQTFTSTTKKKGRRRRRRRRKRRKRNKIDIATVIE